jgi:urease accessory protein
MSGAFRSGCALIVGLIAFPATASAHHLMGGKLPASAVEGLLSGLSHPVIGLDHFFVVLAIGILSARMQDRVWIPGAFLLASLLGTAIHLGRIDLAGVQVVIAGSVVCFGAALAARRQGHRLALLVAAFGAGVFHGYTYAESIVGAELTPLVAYLVGFTAIQLAIAMAGGALAHAAPRLARSRRVLLARAFGTVMSLSGIVLLAKILIGRG